MTKKVDAVEEIEEKQLQIIKIKVRHLPRITKYFKETGLKGKIEKIIFPQEEVQTITWAELREEADLSLDELKDIQKNSEGNIHLALQTTAGAEHLVPKQISPIEITQLIYETIFEVIDDEAIFEKTVDMLSFLYNITTEEVEDMSILEVKDAVMNAINEQDFL